MVAAGRLPHRQLVVWWNVQRLLHPGGSSLGRELDATEANGWTEKAYLRKVSVLGAVLRLICGEETPSILALCEVEDAKAANAVAAAAGFRLEVLNDPAARLIGDDLVLLYDPAVCGPVGAPSSYNVHNRYTTRDIFEATFNTGRGHRLCVITNHWPSRRISGSEALRIGAADYCRRLVDRKLRFSKDELVTTKGHVRMPSRARLEARANEAVLLLGDFNDEPFDTSVKVALGATRDRRDVTGSLRLPDGRDWSAVNAYLSLAMPLFNPTWPHLVAADGSLGTTRWGRSRYMLDQVIVSRGLLGTGPIRFVEDSLRIHAVPSVKLMGGESVRVATRGGTPLPFDPLRGVGASDHLPLSFHLETT